MTLTSYEYKSVELNDDINYLIPDTDLTFDDSQNVEPAYAYRQDNTPIQTGLTIKEGIISLTINIKAVYGETATQFDTKVDTLRKIFNTRDPQFYPLYRQRPHEAFRKFLMVACRGVSVSRTLRRVVVTLHTTDRVWQAEDEETETQLLFDGPGNFEETMTVEYAGLFPVEPTIDLKLKTPGSDGPMPLYFREVTVWTAGRDHVIHTPLKVVESWDVSAIVSALKLSASLSDLSVSLPSGALLPRLPVKSGLSVWDLWVLCTEWPDLPECTLVADYRTGDIEAVPPIALTDADDKLVVSVRGPRTIPESGTIYVNGEKIEYDSVSYEDTRAVFSLVTRQADGTPPAGDLEEFIRVLLPTTLRVNYGYADDFKVTFNKGKAGWPLLDYNQSTNTYWHVEKAYPRAGPANPHELKWEVYTDHWNLQLSDTMNAAQAQQTLELSGAASATKLYPGTHLMAVLPSLNWYSRKPSSVQLDISLRGGASGQPVTVNLDKVMSGLDTNAEIKKTLWTYTHSSSSESLISSPDKSTDAWYHPYTHLAVRFPSIPTTTDPSRLVARIEKIVLTLDDDDFGRHPVISDIGDEQGLDGGLYPTFLWVRNDSDPQNQNWFYIAARMEDEAELSVDCAEKTVTGALLTDLSYQRSVWLRLLPGSNTLRFKSTPGTGDQEVTVRWRNRY